MSDEAILQVNNLVKEYDSIRAVDNISFSIKPGEIVGLLGPNGAGKTTVINMILGVLAASSGEIQFLGKNIWSKDADVKKRLNFAAVYAHLPGNLTAKETLYIFGLIYGAADLEKKIAGLVKEFDLGKFINTKVGLLSSGEQSRLSLAKAMINDPCLILLDEPTASLDPTTAEIVRGKIKNYVKTIEAGVLWTSHNMQEVEKVCDRVLFLSGGKILFAGRPQDILKEYGQANMEELFITVDRNNFK